MSVFVNDFKPGGGSWTVGHDDATGGSHIGTVTATSVAFGKQIDGTTPDFHTTVITCPVCAGASCHPIGGGAQPKAVQEMFVRMMMRLGCPCGGHAAGKSAFLTISHARQHVNSLEGPARWQVASIIP